jgi:flagellar biosynthetic protein FliO
MLLSQQSAAQSWQALGIFVLETLAALAIIALAAWAVVRFGRGWLARGGRQGRMRIVERLVLEPRRSIYLIEVDGKTMLIGSSDGSVRLLENLGPVKTEEATENKET